ncbi:serine acetyltransferase [Gordonia alkanivorans]|uniref:serine acetyltransferase n=1 Tax=Gordonia alkanivorans TaxID=84096 RepID=UPI0009DDC7BB
MTRERSREGSPRLTVRGSAEGLRFFRMALSADLKSNPSDLRSRALLAFFRFTQLAMGDLRSPRKLSYPIVALYRFFSEVILGVELRPKVHVGPGLAVHHGYGLVVNNDATIGSGVTLRHGVTIGHKTAGGGSPIIEDGVEFGANSCAIGEIRIGYGSKIGPGVVVTRSVEPCTTLYPPSPVNRQEAR